MSNTVSTQFKKAEFILLLFFSISFITFGWMTAEMVPDIIEVFDTIKAEFNNMIIQASNPATYI